MTSTHDARCRACGAAISTVAADLGVQPLSNSYLRADQLDRMEPHYPLVALFCESCGLVQLGEYEAPAAIFSDYAYFSSYSDSWLEHCRAYVDKVVDVLGLGDESRVVEIASNDGYLLQYFAEHGVPASGVEPAENVAQVAQQRGIPTLIAFFGEGTAREMRAVDGPADLIVANNVLAHVPDLNDFVAGLQVLLHERGTATLEFPHLLKLIEERQFDTIYHEHFSYFSLLTVQSVFAAHGLRVFDVEELPTHGGSLRTWVCQASDERRASDRVEVLRRREQRAGLDRSETFSAFAAAVAMERRHLTRFFLDVADHGASIAGYGAPAKGNTLLNYCGIRSDLLPFTVDRSPHKQGMYLPGSRIPILGPSAIDEAKPEMIFVLPWNLRQEIESQLAHVREWGGRFVARGSDLRVT